MLRLHLTLNMLDCLDDILDLVQDLPAEDLRGIDKKQLIMLMEIVYDKKCDIDKEILLNKRRKNGR
ncbi:MAG: hypothetical protein Unbinned2902contig1001_21 [Prokaryotic dsDNA virus sp.]|nr:MAG: hypothetical protein Unbinned2902contig1001_21 [Prokaryotic dsDNA virus sp.]